MEPVTNEREKLIIGPNDPFFLKLALGLALNEHPGGAKLVDWPEQTNYISAVTVTAMAPGP